MEIGLLQVIKEGEQAYIASYPKLEIYSYGKTVQDAILRLKQIIKFYIESAKELGISVEGLCNFTSEKTFMSSAYLASSQEGWIEIDVKVNLN